MRSAVHTVLCWLGFAIPLLFCACHGQQRQQMLALLDEADSLNRAYAQLPSDTLLLEAADFFDRHGSANERLRAHYLLGCAYRDMGDAPRALQCFLDAVDYADTLSSSCDLQSLMAVYGQIAELYHAQHLPYNEISAAKEYGHFALLAKDTLKYIRNIELISKAYDLLGDTANMLNYIFKAQQLFDAFGYHQNAVQAYAAPIYVAINRGELDSALHMMQKYETLSGLFDESGNIETGREGYYYFKGLYYLRRDSLNQSEAYMRKMLGTTEEINGYRGLMTIYNRRNNADSTAHYAHLFEQALDKKSNSREMDVIHRMGTLYNYQRSERLASQKTIETLHMRQLTGMLIAASIIMLVLLLARIKILGLKEKEAMKKYFENIDELRQARAELITLQRNAQENSMLIASREERIRQLEYLVKAYQEKEAYAHSDIQFDIEKDDIYKHFHILANKGKRPTANDWESILASIHKTLPDTSKLFDKFVYTLNETEFHVWILTRLNIKPTQISYMLNVSGPYVSQVRRELLQKVFNQVGKPGDFDRLTREIC